MREEMKARGIKLRTRVKVGRNDLDFSTKMPNSVWKSEPIPGGLPKIDLEAGRKSSITSSPPPGRPNLTKAAQDNTYRKRPFSDSDVDESAKKSKGDTHSDTVDLSRDHNIQAGEQGDMELDIQGAVGGSSLKSTEKVDIDQEASSSNRIPDPGRFTDTEAYSPLTPAKTKSIPNLAVLINSPVFHKKGKNIQ